VETAVQCFFSVAKVYAGRCTLSSQILVLKMEKQDILKVLHYGKLLECTSCRFCTQSVWIQHFL